MALERNMSLERMKNFLNEEVKEQILYEIAPILHLGYSPGGYFGVTKQIVCMIDFLGALYSGFDSIKDVQTRRDGKVIKKIASSTKALKFIKEILGEIDSNYKDNGKYLIEMYRHGLVHLYQPKQLKLRNGKVLQWLSYKGGRTGDIEIRTGWIIKNASHLVEISDAGSNFLPVSIRCLYNDLLTAIDFYQAKLKNSNELQDKFISAANEISEPEEYEEVGT